MQVFKSHSLSDLELIAKSIVSQIQDIKVILFFGEMGVGKTTLIKIICKLLDVKEEVSSPTYSLVNEYLSDSNLALYHFDFYRINDELEAYDIGCEEYFDSGNVCLVEWPEKIKGLWPSSYLKIEILLKDNFREITLRQIT